MTTTPARISDFGFPSDFGFRVFPTLVFPLNFRHKQRVPSAANVLIHPSQFPEAIQRDFIESLRARQVNHKFHYDSPKQTQKWLALHQAYSPSRSAADCAAAYESAFAAAAAHVSGGRIHLVGLGCGGGQKDTQLLRLFEARKSELYYTPCDVSTAMVLVARQTALAVLPERHCLPLVCDLMTAEDFQELIEAHAPSDADRVLTFFGMIPNFEPAAILPKLASLVGQGDLLLFSANLSPGPDYSAGIRRILPQYDNEITRDWLMNFLLDLGVERTDGKIAFRIEEFPAGSGLKRVAAYFQFTSPRQLLIGTESFEFRSGESIRLFFSYRHTPQGIGDLLREHGLKVLDQWVAASGEEGVFLVSAA